MKWMDEVLRAKVNEAGKYESQTAKLFGVELDLKLKHRFI